MWWKFRWQIWSYFPGVASCSSPYRSLEPSRAEIPEKSENITKIPLPGRKKGKNNLQSWGELTKFATKSPPHFSLQNSQNFITLNFWDRFCVKITSRMPTSINWEFSGSIFVFFHLSRLSPKNDLKRFLGRSFRTHRIGANPEKALTLQPFSFFGIVQKVFSENTPKCVLFYGGKDECSKMRLKCAEHLW